MVENCSGSIDSQPIVLFNVVRKLAVLMLLKASHPKNLNDIHHCDRDRFRLSRAPRSCRHGKRERGSAGLCSLNATPSPLSSTSVTVAICTLSRCSQVQCSTSPAAL